MKASRGVIVFWLGVIVVLLAVELAELTGGFTLPVQSVIANPIGFITALIFTTILALVGAIFIGLYIGQRWMSSRGFTPFEEEMMRMHRDVREIKEALARDRRNPAEPSPPMEPRP